MAWGFIGTSVGHYTSGGLKSAGQPEWLPSHVHMRVQSLDMFGYVLSAAAVATASAAGYQSMAPSGQWYGKTFTRLPRPCEKTGSYL